MRTGVSGNGKGAGSLVLVLSIVALFAVAPARANAASTDCFLKIDTVPGDSTERNHKDQIDVLTWGFGDSQPMVLATGGGAGMAGRVQMQDFRFTARMGRQSPRLLQECAAGKRFREATLTCQSTTGAGPLEFLQVKFEDVVVTGYQTGTPSPAGQATLAGADTYPVDQVSLGFSRIRVQFNVQKRPDGSGGGSVMGGWDVRLNKIW